MKRQFFITKKTILKILAYYGGRRKYEYMVTLTDTSGRITQKDFFSLEGEKIGNN